MTALDRKENAYFQRGYAWKDFYIGVQILMENFHVSKQETASIMGIIIRILYFK